MSFSWNSVYIFKHPVLYGIYEFIADLYCMHFILKKSLSMSENFFTVHLNWFKGNNPSSKVSGIFAKEINRLKFLCLKLANNLK